MTNFIESDIEFCDQDYQPKLSVLISARKNSKYLAKFLFGLIQNTKHIEDIEVLVMLNKHDTWNKELVSFINEQTGRIPYIEFFYEDHQLGRAGLHVYFNELAEKSHGDWLIYFCEDHFINMLHWDEYITYHIDHKWKLNSEDVWCLIPKFDNCGAMNQIISRGYYKALGGVVGRHGWIDSYLNDVNRAAFGSTVDKGLNDRVRRFDDEMFHDFTHDQPSPMSDAHCQSVVSDAGRALPKYDDPEVKRLIQEDAEKLLAYIKERNER